VHAGTPQGGQVLFALSRVLRVLSAEDQLGLSERCVPLRFDKDQVVYVAGDPADSMLVLTAGQLKVSNYSVDGTEFILASVLPGETIGELGMLSDTPRTATVTAMQPSSGLMLSRSVVMALIERQSAVAVAMLKHLADMTRRMNGVASDLVFLDVHQRVASYLLDNVVDSTATIRTTQSFLASAVGASRQRVNVCLQEFQSNGWISLSSGVIRVRDAESLDRVILR
jgi:CRP/FNR family cyclic AMP-dependent transcriptional regulator